VQATSSVLTDAGSDRAGFDGSPAGNLALDIDPKLAWALRHREFFPVDVNKAGKEALLRVPGIGVRNAKRIVAARRHGALRLIDLKKLKTALSRARAFIITADHHADTLLLDSPGLKEAVITRPRSPLRTAADSDAMSLFETVRAARTARTGEL
jgi:predicted DNA-binding helix-hairpin-helix protein